MHFSSIHTVDVALSDREGLGGKGLGFYDCAVRQRESGME